MYRKVDELKKQRKDKKGEYKKGNQGFRKQIEDLKHKISLGKACLVVLNTDKDQQQREAANIDGKIDSHNRKIDYLSKSGSQVRKNVPLDKMSYSEVLSEQNRITPRMSSENLTKAQEAELNVQLNKISKQKVLVDKKVPVDNKYQ